MSEEARFIFNTTLAVALGAVLGYGIIQGIGKTSDTIRSYMNTSTPSEDRLTRLENILLKRAEQEQ